MQQIAVVLVVFILLAALGKTSSVATYKMRVCAGSIYDYKNMAPDCSVTEVGANTGI